MAKGFLELYHLQIKTLQESWTLALSSYLMVLKENGYNHVSHEYLSLQTEVKSAGYMYIWISNENEHSSGGVL